jgi:hypothetical protein
MDGESKKFVDLVIDELTYSGAIDINQYFVMETRIAHYTIPPRM